MNTKLTAIVVSLLTIISMTAVMATDYPDSTGNVGVIVTPPAVQGRAYELKYCYDIGLNDWWGGSTPDQSVNPSEIRGNEYLFTGEQLQVYYLIRDPNGVEDISSAKLFVGDTAQALCNEVSAYTYPVCPYCNDGHDLSYYIQQNVPAWGTLPANYNPATDKVFECILTVEPSWYGDTNVHIVSYRDAGEIGIEPDSGTQWFFNPAIVVDLKTSDSNSKIWFQQLSDPTQFALSGNNLKIKNEAEGGVGLWAWISMDDLTDPSNSGAKCPLSNVFDVEGVTPKCPDCGVWYQTLSRGTAPMPNWEHMSNPDGSQGCVLGTAGCRGAKNIMGLQSPYNTFPSMLFNIIGAQQEAEIHFKLKYPTPCIGSFTNGNIHVIVRAI